MRAVTDADDDVRVGPGIGGGGAFFLLLDKPESYGLPSAPKLPSRSVWLASLLSIVTAFMTALGVLFAFREGRRPNLANAVPAPDNAETLHAEGKP